MPDPGWAFSGWGGDAAGTMSPVTVLMDGDKTVTATFALVIGFDFKPHDLDLNSKDKWVTGYLRPPAPFLASQIDVPSIRLNGTVAVSGAVSPQVEEHDARLKVKFLRSDVKPTLAPGDHVAVTVTGTIAGQSLIGADSIRVKGPKVHTPRAGDQLAPGATATVSWDPPDSAASVTLLSSLDDGATWNIEAQDVPNTGSYAWSVPSVSTAQARLEILAVYAVDDAGIIPESEWAVSDAFSIQAPAAVDDGPVTFALRCVNPVIGPLTVHLSLATRAGADLAVYDVSGRLVVSRRITSGPGRRTMMLGALPSGIYVVRLSQGGRRLSYRVAALR